jgi:peptidoglycan/xylan/chitin deacetylase (PgdA/CDA1 family)
MRRIFWIALTALSVNFSSPASADDLSSSASSLPILVYHQIAAEGDDSHFGPVNGPISISLSQFETQMRYLNDQGYVTLGMDEVVSFMKGKPFPKKIVAIHFDDGLKSALKAVPVLNSYGFKATFWIIPGKGIGWPHMDWDEIEALATSPRLDIFSHTMTHPWKENETLPDWIEGRTPDKGIEQARWELTESRHVLEQKLQRPIPYLAWPAGKYNDRLIKLAQEVGYQALLTIDRGLNHPGDDPLRIHRSMVDGSCDQAAFVGILTNEHPPAYVTRTTASAQNNCLVSDLSTGGALLR